MVGEQHEKKGEQQRNERDEERLLKERMEEIRRTIMQIVLREVEIIERYVQFKMRELTSKGLDVNMAIFRRVEEDAFTIIIRIDIPEHVYKRAFERYAELLGLLKHIERTARIVDRMKYKFE